MEFDQGTPPVTYDTARLEHDRRTLASLDQITQPLSFHPPAQTQRDQQQMTTVISLNLLHRFSQKKNDQHHLLLLLLSPHLPYRKKEKRRSFSVSSYTQISKFSNKMKTTERLLSFSSLTEQTDLT